MRAFITGVAGPALTDEERQFLRDAEPWGLIVFKRNVADPDPLRRLIDEFRTLSAATRPSWSTRKAAGCSGSGRRIGRAIRRAPPMARSTIAIVQTGLAAARLGARLIAADLAALGIDVDCLPLADVPVPGADPVIGDRAYGSEPGKVAAIAGAIAEGLMAGGVLPVLKHMPGHGRATADSH